jgi:hypothetical protein
MAIAQSQYKQRGDETVQEAQNAQIRLPQCICQKLKLDVPCMRDLLLNLCTC